MKGWTLTKSCGSSIWHKNKSLAGWGNWITKHISFSEKDILLIPFGVYEMEAISLTYLIQGNIYHGCLLFMFWIINYSCSEVSFFTRDTKKYPWSKLWQVSGFYNQLTSLKIPRGKTPRVMKCLRRGGILAKDQYLYHPLSVVQVVKRTDSGIVNWTWGFVCNRIMFISKGFVQMK